MYCQKISIADEVVQFYYGHNCFEELWSRLVKLEPDRFLIITDNIVEKLYGTKLRDALQQFAPTLLLSTQPGEAGKNLETLGGFAERAVKWGMTRRSIVIALGGGVPGNLGGLLAALLFRGIRLVHIPTTLIGALDSVVSFKQAVNSRFGKNLIGTFYKPAFVLVDTRMLETLPAREVRAGLCEVIKNALAIHPHIIEYLRKCLSPTCKFEADTFRRLLEFSLAAKASVLADDKWEKRRGLILEYGHTIGHAIELADVKANGEAISHGEAVGVGMIGAAQIAFQMGVLDETSLDLHYELLQLVGARCSPPDTTPPERVLHFLRFDNKRGYSNGNPDLVEMILLRCLGKPLAAVEMPLTAVPFSLVESSVRSLYGARVRHSEFQEVK